MADDERRAEIETIKRVLQGSGCGSGWAHFNAPKILDALDRVRDARGDESLRDEAVRNVDGRHGYTMEFAPSPEAHREEYDAEGERLRDARGDDEYPRGTTSPCTPYPEAGKLGSPQGEGHEAGIEAVAVVINRTRAESIPVDDDDRHEAREAIDAYLSRVSPSPASGTEPDTLGEFTPEQREEIEARAVEIAAHLKAGASSMEPDTAKLVEDIYRWLRCWAPPEQREEFKRRFLAGFSVGAEKPKDETPLS